MTEDTNTTEPEAAPAAGSHPEAESVTEDAADPADDTAADTDAPGDNRDGKLAAEAAKWRVAARQAETHLAIAEARIAELRTAEVEQVVTDSRKLADAKDLWLSPGLTLDALLGDDGNIDKQLVNEAVDELLAAKPHWRNPIGAPSSAVNGNGTIPSPGQALPSWMDVIRGGA